VTGTGYEIIFWDSNSDSYFGACTTGATCQVTVPGLQRGGSDAYRAYISQGPYATGTYSNLVTVTWV
jgi:hypothetical protein